MTIEAGSLLGPYEIVSPLSAGGMGEVWLARDSRLEREVAIKVLPEGLAGDPDRMRRFEKEARTVSALNHPNIVTIHDVDRVGSVGFLVMERVDGKTLRELLASGPLAVKKTLQIAAQIADGLAAAHEAGVVHRDLKPENVMVTRDGLVKILDFGLAKPTRRNEMDVYAGATTVTLGTDPGMVVGTARYMSPEQACGKALDFRSDQFSFGSVVYEMLTARSPFSGATTGEMLAAIIRDAPEPIASLDPRVPVPVRWIVDRCLEKDPGDRYASTRDLARDLATARDHVSEVSGPAVSKQDVSTRRSALAIGERAAWAAAAVALAALLFQARSSNRRPSADSLRRFEASVNAPEKALFRTGEVAISPDGARLVFATTDGRLWVRDLSQLQARELPAAKGGQYPFWSPDGGSVAFFADHKLKVMNLSDASARVICDARWGRGGAWSREGVIVFAPDYRGPLLRVPATGGEPTSATELDASRRDYGHRFPCFLSDGRHFLYLATLAGQGPQNLPWIVAGSLDSKESTPLLRAGSAPAYAPPGDLLYVRADRTLVAQPFDERRLRTTGPATPIAEQVSLVSQRSNAGFSVSRTGVLVYQSGVLAPSKLVWLGPTGKEVGSASSTAEFGDARLSPDGRRAAVEVVDARSRTFDIWIYDLERGGATRWTNDPADDRSPIWSPDASQIVFGSFRRGNNANLFIGAVDGTSAERLFDSPHEKRPTDWSPDGRWILYNEFDPKTNWDVWLLPLFGDRRPRPFLATESLEEFARFSPDGRWVAFQSDETGRFEVYRTPFPGPGVKAQVSTNGGRLPRWGADGRAIFYVEGDRRLMSVAISTGSSTFTGAPKLLFESSESLGSYNPAPDSEKFLVVAPDKDLKPPPLTVVVNWAAGSGK